MADKPKYMDKHPCAACTTGYGECAQWLKYGQKCCSECSHPTRWLPNPWTPEDIIEMEKHRRK